VRPLVLLLALLAMHAACASLSPRPPREWLDLAIVDVKRWPVFGVTVRIGDKSHQVDGHVQTTVRGRVLVVASKPGYAETRALLSPGVHTLTLYRLSTVN
jgi:hypothetical protein